MRGVSTSCPFWSACCHGFTRFRHAGAICTGGCVCNSDSDRQCVVAMAELIIITWDDATLWPRLEADQKKLSS